MTVRLQAACFRLATVLLLFLTQNVLSADEASVDEGQRFVAVGQLAKMQAGGGRETRFVLLDAQGEVISSLRPAAGIDLAKHIGEEVGITARTLVNSDTPILLAENVTTFGLARQTSNNDFEAHVALASHEEERIANAQVLPSPVPMPVPMSMSGNSLDGYPIAGNPIITEEYLPNGFVSGNQCGVAGCDSCGGGCGSVACKSCAACPCGLPGRFWIRSEYLIWWTKGVDTPPLLVSSPPGTSSRNAGVLGVPGNVTLYGGEILDDSRSGGRFRIGKWFDRCNWVGFETDFFFLGDEDQNYSDASIGGIVGRPITSTSAGPSAQLINFPGRAVGTTSINAETSLWSINPRLRVNLSCERFPGCNPCDPCSVGGYRFDVLVGYRFMKLDDSLSIHENVMAPTATANGGLPLIPRFDDVTLFNIRDSFAAENDFHGADIGLSWEGYKGPWSLELMGRVGIGNTSQKVSVRGSTTRVVNGNSFTDQGGILALDSNIGEYSRNEFTILPEVNATLGYSLSPRSRLLVGYSFLYWNNVVRAGEQIDTTVNPDLIPDAQVTTGPNRPEFSFVDTGFWAQGLSLGLDYRW